MEQKIIQTIFFNYKKIDICIYILYFWRRNLNLQKNKNNSSFQNEFDPMSAVFLPFRDSMHSGPARWPTAVRGLELDQLRGLPQSEG